MAPGVMETRSIPRRIPLITDLTEKRKSIISADSSLYYVRQSLLCERQMEQRSLQTA